MAQAQRSQQQQAADQNHQMRQALIASGVRAQKKLGTLTGVPGATVRQKIFNVGVITSLLIDVTVPVTIGTANAVQSLRGPYNFISNIKLKDFDGTDRINCSGFQLFELNCVRTRTFYGYNNEVAAAVLVNPSYPIATGNRSVQFLLEIPIAFDADNPIIELIDLRGAIMAQTAVGEMYLTIDTNPNLISVTGDIDSLFSGAGTTTVVANGVFSIDVFQNYILPQTPPGMDQPPLPWVDLMTVYECAGGLKTTDNLAVGMAKVLNYPNARTVVGAYYNYVTGGSAALGQISAFQLVANGNNTLEDHTERSKLFKQRRWLNSDFVPGSWFSVHREHPIETSLFGNIQTYIVPAVVSGGNQYIEYMYEAFFLKGQALPGTNQG